MPKKLKIAQVGTIWEKIPPKLYGGTERVVYCLTEELVRQGHNVTLFATGDSKTSAELVSLVPKPLYRNGIPWTNFLYPLQHISQVFEQADKFDLIHMHLNNRQDYVSLVLAGFVKIPTVFTTHFVMPENNAEKRDRYQLLYKYRRRNFISISDAQRTLKFLNYVGTVHNGLDFNGYHYDLPREDYVVWLGRFCHEKGAYEAIQAASLAGKKLVLAGKVDQFNEEFVRYYNKKVKPYIDANKVKFIGEANDAQKIRLLGRATALLHPINWNEPFGLTTIESMACGTPVIAFERGPVREQVRNGKTGFIVKNVKQMAQAIKKAGALNHRHIHQYAIRNFSSERMANDYVKIYRKVLGK